MMNHTFDTAGPGDDGELVQRFVDQELSAEERVQFLSRLGRDEALRQRTIDLEQLVLDAGRLPRPIVPDGFAASVMERLVRCGAGRCSRPRSASESGGVHRCALRTARSVESCERDGCGERGVSSSPRSWSNPAREQ
jgi:hypothetical protein